jgi:FkbM family methyltransferase
MQQIMPQQLGLLYGAFMLRQLIDLLRIDMIFDIGANAGQYGMALRKQIGYLGPLVSFEPLPVPFLHLQALASKDSCWDVHCCAVSEESGRAWINMMAGDQFSSFLFPREQYRGRFHGQSQVIDRIEVERITLADAFTKSPGFGRGLLKIDTQGTELHLLEAHPDTLREFSGVQMEMSIQPIYEGQPTFEMTLEKMRSWGFALSAIFPNNEGHFPHLLEMDALFIRQDLLPTLP